MKYVFTDDYLTGIASVDAQHSKLFDLTNECYELVMEVRQTISMTRSLRSWRSSLTMPPRILHTKRRMRSVWAIRIGSATVHCTCAL